MSKNILIVGGTHGIGKSLVELLKPQDHKLWVYGRSADPQKSDINTQYVKFDVLSDELSPLDVDHLDGLVYCPGSINLKPFGRLSEKDFQEELNINFLSAVKVIQNALPLLKKAETSSIVLFSTVAVSQGMPYHASIAAAKGAIEGFGRSIAAELAPKIRVNMIAPSIVDTPLAGRLLSTEEKKEASGTRHPLKRVGESRDIAEMAAFLLSDKSNWMTGQVLGVDGGMSTLRAL